MKIAVLLCLVVALTGCDKVRGFFHRQNGVDSPIIVTDGSPETHLRHKGGAAADFEILNDGSSDKVEANDSGFVPTSIECFNASGCPKTPLVQGWVLNLFSSVDASGSAIVTIVSPMSSSSLVATDFLGAEMVLGKDATTGGSDVNAKHAPFLSASFTNGTSGTNLPLIKCLTSPCKICIHYETTGAVDKPCK